MKLRWLLLLGLAVALALVAVAPAQQEVLYEKQSPFSKIQVIQDDDGLRTLMFDENDVRQSVVKVGDPDHIELPYARVMPVGLALVEKPRRILIVGLGGGTIPMFLHKHYPRATIDVVDIDPVVVDVAQRFFGFRQDARLRAHVGDGRRFIEQTRKPYDLIFLDAYGPEDIPYHLATREFLEAVRRALAPGGVVVGNLFSSYSNPFYDSMVRTYQEVFDEVYIFDVRLAGNEILIALPRRIRISSEDLSRRAAAVSKQKRFRFDMGELVTYGYNYADKQSIRGHVLTDKNKKEIESLLD